MCFVCLCYLSVCLSVCLIKAEEDLTCEMCLFVLFVCLSVCLSVPIVLDSEGLVGQCQ